MYLTFDNRWCGSSVHYVSTDRYLCFSTTLHVFLGKGYYMGEIICRYTPKPWRYIIGSNFQTHELQLLIESR